jgi:hypothetical protein
MTRSFQTAKPRVSLLISFAIWGDMVLVALEYFDNGPSVQGRRI